MLQVNSILSVLDNTGIKFGKCIRIMRDRSKLAGVTDLISFAIQRVRKKKKYIKKNIYTGLIINACKKIHRPDGSSVLFKNNSMLTLSDTYKLMGSRIFGIIPRELAIVHKDRKRNFKKIIIKGRLLL